MRPLKYVYPFIAIFLCAISWSGFCVAKSSVSSKVHVKIKLINKDMIEEELKYRLLQVERHINPPKKGSGSPRSKSTSSSSSSDGSISVKIGEHRQNGSQSAGGSPRDKTPVLGIKKVSIPSADKYSVEKVLVPKDASVTYKYSLLNPKINTVYPCENSEQMSTGQRNSQGNPITKKPLHTITIYGQKQKDGKTVKSYCIVEEARD